MAHDAKRSSMAFAKLASNFHGPSLAFAASSTSLFKSSTSIAPRPASPRSLLADKTSKSWL
eukprot:8694302-Alexandrium_andersonii.AAC.1